MQLPFTIVFDRRLLVTRLLVRPDVAALILHADGRCGIERRDGNYDEALIDPASSVVFPGLVVLHYRVADRRESLVLPHAGMGSTAHRRLRVWLRWRMTDVARNHDPA